jgi:hypothetical protein
MGALVERHYGAAVQNLDCPARLAPDVLGRVAADEIERLSRELLVFGRLPSVVDS